MEANQDPDEAIITISSETGSCSSLSSSSQSSTRSARAGPSKPSRSKDAESSTSRAGRPGVRPRSASTDSSTTKSPEVFRDFRKRMKARLASIPSAGPSTMVDLTVEDCYAIAVKSAREIRGKTGLIYSDTQLAHKCTWDKLYPENPERYTAIMDRIREKGLDNECKILTPIVYIEAEKQLKEVHAPGHIKSLKLGSTILTCTQQEKMCQQYDAIFINKATYSSALIAMDATITLVDEINRGKVQNGLAVVRPPGHHAQHADFNGYCFFNNVSIAAKYLLSEGVQKILIVDFDVHHGQGTQYQFYDSKSVLYFSIHRYEYGKFWPNLKESNFDHIGKGDGIGYNINVPLNGFGFGDAEYLAILTHILLPVAYEFQPDFIIFSAGYDACIGCPEGQMEVSPGFYGHLIKMLSGLAQGKLAVVLEGGYFLPSLAEGVAMTLEALLDGRPALLPKMEAANVVVASTINDIKYVLHPHWTCFNVFSLNPVDCSGDYNVHRVMPTYLGDVDEGPYKTRHCYPVLSSKEATRFTMLVQDYQLLYSGYQENSVCYSYDERCKSHAPLSGDPPENPKRIQVVLEQLRRIGLDRRCEQVLHWELLDVSLLKDVHDAAYIDKLLAPNYKPVGNLDLYWNNDGSISSITAAVNSLLQVCEAVASGKGKFSSGFAIIRPPGHHAEVEQPMGFCYLNNVAVAAQYLQRNHGLKRILILDFDIHHGNGTQQIFYETDRVLYISIHKYENGNFFPKGTNGKNNKTGAGAGEGFNVNIPFNHDKMGDSEYITAFFRIILPIAYEYAPEVILVSAGFDAGVNDLLGNYTVTPEAFGHMIQLLRPLANGKLILALEGGYNLATLKHSVCFCVKALLGDPLPKLRIGKLQPTAHKAIQAVVDIQKRYWSTLCIDKPLPDRLSMASLSLL